MLTGIMNFLIFKRKKAPLPNVFWPTKKWGFEVAAILREHTNF